MLVKSMLRYEIITLLVVKFVLLFLIWKVCFAHPQDKSIVPNDVTKHLLSSVTLTQRISHD